MDVRSATDRTEKASRVGRRVSLSAVLRRGAYPVLLAGVALTGAASLHFRWEPGRLSILSVLAVVAYLALLERLIPYERRWHPDAREWAWYGCYFLLTMAGGAVAQFLVSSLVGVVAPPEPTLPRWAEIPLALLLGSLASYVIHRLGHTRPLLWRLHGVHHVPQKVNVANNGVSHILDVVLSQGVVQLTLAAAGFSHASLAVVSLFVVAQGYFVHANIDVRIGRLNHVFASPEQHRLHHSVDISEAGHYGSDLSLWDHAFGSFTWHPDRRPAAVGLSEPASFPATGDLLATFLHPLRRR
ncbi:sterol desaturase family protein [Streptomyces olivaceiscleroticus]